MNEPYNKAIIILEQKNLFHGGSTVQDVTNLRGTLTLYFVWQSLVQFMVRDCRTYSALRLASEKDEKQHFAYRCLINNFDIWVPPIFVI